MASSYLLHIFIDDIMNCLIELKNLTFNNIKYSSHIVPKSGTVLLVCILRA